MDSFTIVGIKDEILRKVAADVLPQDIDTEEFQDLCDAMFAAIPERGVALAAPQIGRSIRMFVMGWSAVPGRPDMGSMPETVVVNPIITYNERSQKSVDYESCLCMPGMFGLVPRWNEVSLTFLGRDGKAQEKVFRGFLARVVQHEIDHLNGRLFIDLMHNSDELITREEYDELFKRSN